MFNWQKNGGKTNSQSVIKEICPHKPVNHHREHRRWNREINQFCHSPISKYWEILYRCIATHYPMWAGSRSWVRRHRLLHISITGDGVRSHPCLIFKSRIWPENNICRNSLIICYWSIFRVNYSREITHKYLSCRTTWEYCHIYVRVAGFWQRVFQTLLHLNVHISVTLQHTLMIFSTINVKDLIM